MKRLLLFLALLVPSVAFGQNSAYQSILLGPTGRPLAGAVVTVCSSSGIGIPCSPTVNIFNSAGAGISNPTFSDGLGNLQFWAPPGTYIYTVTGNGITPYTQSAVLPCIVGASCANAGILPNTPLAFSATPSFAATVSASYSITLTGNVTSSTITGTPINGNLLSLTLVEDGTGGRTFAFPGNFVIPVGYTFDTTATHTNALTFKFDGTNWNLISNSGGGGGASPLGNNGDLQSKNGAALAASGENDNGTTLAISRDQQNAGPNPSFDLRAFGGYIANSAGTMTCTISSGSATLNCTSNPDFKDATGIPGSSLGHGVVVPGAGVVPTITTPGTPTVTPNLLNGATTWNYKVIAEDYKGGLTAATAAGTTAVGSAALGATSFAITTATRASGTTTYTTSSPHNLQPGATLLICQFGGGACPGTFLDAFNGTKTVVATPTSTTFTVSDGNVPDGSETPGSGLGNVLACNTLTFAANSYSGVGTLRYWIYRSQGAGAYSLAGVAVGLDPYFVDCGTPAPSSPSYLPATPPSSPQAGYLATTIASGGGTNTLTLAASAGTTATSVTASHDNSQNLIAAMNAAAGQSGGTVYIPSFPNSGGQPVFWVFNGLTDFTQASSINANVVTVLINGYIALGQPWNLRTGITIQGQTKRNTSFMYPGGALIGGGAQPLLYVNTKNSIVLRNLYLNPSSAQGSGFYTDNDNGGNGSTGLIIENVGVASGGLGYGRPVVLKGGFDYLFRQFSCDGVLGATLMPYPCVEFTNSSIATSNTASQVPGRVVMSDSYLIGSGMLVDNINTVGSSSGTIFRFTGFTYESGHTPFLRIGPMGFTTDYNLTDINVSDQVTGSGTPLVDGSGSQLGLISITGGSMTGGAPPMLISGYVATSLFINHPASANVGNTPWFSFAQWNSEINNMPLDAKGTGRFTYQMATPGAPSGCVVSAGGAIPIGVVTYGLTAVDADGQETFIGPTATVTTTTGNQTVTCNLPSRPTGAIGFMAYHSFGAAPINQGNKVSVVSCPTPQFTGSTFVDTVNSNCGTVPNTNTAGSSIVSSTGLSSNAHRFPSTSATGFVYSEVNNSFSAAQTETKPDASGTTVTSTVAETAARTGQVPVASNGGAVVLSSPGIADGNAGAAVTTTPYTILCDSATTLRDRSTTIRFQAGASVINLPDHTASGCGSNMAFVLINESVSPFLTINRGGSDTLSVYGQISPALTGQTSFSLYPNQTVSLNNGAGVIWEARVTSNPSPLAIVASNYGVKRDVKWITDATLSTANAIIDCTFANDCNFVAGTDNGKACWATNAQSDLSQTAVVVLPEGTLTVTDAQHATCSGGNATANQTHNSIFLWGHIDSAILGQTQSTANDPLFAAWTDAQTKCLPLILDGASFIEQGEFNTWSASSACGQDVSIEFMRFGYTIKGNGRGSTFLIPTPKFDPTTCTGPNGTGVNCLFAFPNPFISGLQVWSAGNNACGAGFNGKTLWAVLGHTFGGGANGLISGTMIQAWCGNTAGTIGLNLGAGGGTFSGIDLRDVWTEFAGCTPLDVAGPLIVNWFGGDFWGGCTNGYAAILEASNPSIFNTVRLINGSGGTSGNIFVQGGNTWNDTGSYMYNASSASATVVNRGTVNLDGTVLNFTNAGQAGLYNITSPGTYHLRGVQNTGTALTAGRYFFSDTAGTLNVFDDCGNSTALFSGFTGAGAFNLYGSCSITGTALATGNLVPSANWGTSAAVTIPNCTQGDCDSRSFAFTLTNGSAAVGANPTIAFTFPQAFGRTPICTVQQVGGTQAVTAATLFLTPSAASRTGITLTYNGTPTINLTELYQGTCK